MQYQELCLSVVKLAKEVGEFIRTEARSFSSDNIEYKGLNDMVSYVDKTSEEKIVIALSKLLPQSGFLGEESVNNKVADKYNWIIDPLDGTTNFIHGIPTYAVSIALKCDNDLVVGVVYEVERDECFYAWKEGGAYLNGKPIHVSPTLNLAQSLVATGFPYYDFERQNDYLNLFTDVMKKCHGLRRIGAAAVDLAYTACGRFDAYFEYNLKPWDIAAGILIVKEAGGMVTDFKGGDNALETCDIIATNKNVNTELQEIVKQYFK